MTKYYLIFTSVLLAEMGDKTQLATLVFASDRSLSSIGVFIAASAALVASTLVAVVVGNVAGGLLERLPLKAIAGVMFIVIGSLYLWEATRGT